MAPTPPQHHPNTTHSPQTLDGCVAGCASSAKQACGNGCRNPGTCADVSVRQVKSHCGMGSLASCEIGSKAAVNGACKRGKKFMAEV
jgi:hypothetical protein